jgi:DNA-binding NtrC family response regulator
VTGLILLVEADAGLGAVLSELLRHNGYEVILVGTLMNADVDRIDSVNAVILDHDTTAAEKELAWLDALQPCDESLPIVLMGLQAPQELRRRLGEHLDHQQTNALTVVRKPFRNEELLAAVREAKGNTTPGQANGTRRAKVETHEM